jgi:putative acetyltransferase
MTQPAVVAFGRDDPRRGDVRALLEQHLELMRSTTPPEFVFALDVDELVAPAITLCSARRDGELVAVGALKELDPSHGELKSMHTIRAARRGGVGAAMVAHLVGIARDRGYRRVSLETGVQPAFEPAVALYEAAGFERCGAFADYVDNGHSVFMTRRL